MKFVSWGVLLSVLVRCVWDFSNALWPVELNKAK